MSRPAQDSTDLTARDRFERMHDEIRNRICLLDYAPGKRLSETELAAEFGVSRTPLRRVLVRLECEGLLQSVQGVGTFVTDVDVKALAQTYSLRLELAELSGRLSPALPDAALLQQFRAFTDAAAALVAEPEARGFARLNMEFFLALLHLTTNVPLRDTCERLYFQTARICLQSVFSSVIDLTEETRIFHRETEDILAALELGDMTAAAAIQKAHIAMSFTRMTAG